MNGPAKPRAMDLLSARLLFLKLINWSLLSAFFFIVGLRKSPITDNNTNGVQTISIPIESTCGEINQIKVPPSKSCIVYDIA